MKKYGYWLICSAVLFAVLLLCFARTDIYAVSSYPLAFSIEQGSSNTEIAIHESDDGTYYVFLPSYAELDALEIVTLSDSEVSLGETQVTGGMRCDIFELDTVYSLLVDNRHVAELVFCQSANVATLYVNTASGSMDRIHKDKNQSEQAAVLLFTAEGVQNLSDSNAYIKGRGNATWYYGKRPYLLTLSSAADVLGMGAAEKWILLANAADPTNLKNKLILDLARQTGQGWVPECRFVDVYLNGEYAGLYLLTEKVEAGASRLPIDPKSGDFLCKIDTGNRWYSLKNPIKTQLGRTVEISSPDSPDDRSRTDVVAAINRMEQIITSGADLAEVEDFDLDSWIQRYLLDEISGNIDADMVSSYFYRLDGTFYAGPVWDYDMTLGNAPRNINPAAFIAKNANKIGDSLSFYYDALYSNKSFYDRMVACYQSEFLPLLNQLTQSGISELAARIQASARMNDLRWDGRIPVRKDAAVYDAGDLISYLENRMAFLNSAWLEETEYCTLQFKHVSYEEYWIFSVRKGDLLVTDDLDLEHTVWVDEITGRVIDLSQPVMSDMLLAQQDDPDMQGKAMDLDAMKIYVVILSIIVFAVFFSCMIYTDISQRRKERRAANEKNRTHVPS